MLLALLVLATAPATEGPTPVVGANYVQRTMAPLTYYVNASTGSDSKSCTTALAPCLTIQAAVNKVPKGLRDQVVVSIAAGNYAGFVVSGFMPDVGKGSAGAGLLFDGALVNSTLATGSATGTATGGDFNQLPDAFGRLFDTGASWTTNDLTGRLLCTSNASATTPCAMIYTNTATTITVDGWQLWAVPVGGVTTYAIMDPSVIITTPVAQPAGPLVASQANRAAIIGFDNYGSRGLIAFRNMRIANTVGRGVVLGGGGSYQFTQMQIRPTAAQPGITSLTSSPSQPMAGPALALTNTDVYVSAIGVQGLSWQYPSTVALNSSQFRGASDGTTTTYGIMSVGPLFMAGVVVEGFPNEIQTSSSNPDLSSFLYLALTCGTAYNGASGSYGGMNAGATGFWLGTAPAAPPTSTPYATVQQHSAGAALDHTSFYNCDTAVVVDNASADVHGLNGHLTHTGVSILNGGSVLLNTINFAPSLIYIGDAGTALPDGGVQAPINIDRGAITCNFTDPAGTCISALGTSSRVCGYDH